MGDESHEGTLEQASSGYYYVQCSCGWRSRRYEVMVRARAWSHHEVHQSNEAQWAEMRRRIHGD